MQMMTLVLAILPFSATILLGGPPQKPAEPFLVHVIVAEDVAAYGADARANLEEELEKEESWFSIASDEESAEIVLTILKTSTHKGNATATGGPLLGQQFSDHTTIDETVSYAIEAQAVPFGVEEYPVKIFASHDGGGLEKTHENLTQQLVTFCRNNLQTMETMRKEGR